MTEFDYRPEAGVHVSWGLSISGVGSDVDGPPDEGLRRLSDVEAEIEAIVDEYAREERASISRVRGSHGWREFEWSNGAVHRYEWQMELIDLRCAHCKSPDADLYMVRDEVWKSSGLDGWACFRCLERAIGRRLEPADFDLEIPGNTDLVHHEPELRERIGLA